MPLFKAVRPHPLDVGGRMLAAGESADLDPTDPVVADLLSRDDLVAVQFGAVGESGPELLDLPRGAAVLKAPPVPKPKRASEES